MLKLTIEGIHMNINPDQGKYIRKRMNRLEKYVPRRARASAHAEVTLKKQPLKARHNFTCEISLYLPQEILNCQETTQHPYAAIDVATAKLQTQIEKYKDEHGSPKLRRRLLMRLRRRSSGSPVGQ